MREDVVNEDAIDDDTDDDERVSFDMDLFDKEDIKSNDRSTLMLVGVGGGEGRW
jgi:hypothetical protein